MQETKILIYVDNHATIKLTENHIFHFRTKRIDRIYYFVRDKIYKEEIPVEHIESMNMVVDFLTKTVSSIIEQIFYFF